VNKVNVAVLISGRGSNLKAILEAEKNNQLGEAKVTLIISNRSDAKGLEYARDYNKKIEIIENSRSSSREEYDKLLIDLLHQNSINLVVLAGFMRILSSLIVNEFQNKIINIHPALLPSFPGLYAQKQALDLGVKITGCTVHFVDEKVDHGPIILQDSIPIFDEDTEESLSKRILKKEHQLLPRAIKLISTPSGKGL